MKITPLQISDAEVFTVLSAHGVVTYINESPVEDVLSLLSDSPHAGKIASAASQGQDNDAQQILALEAMEEILIDMKMLVEPTLFDEDGRARRAELETLGDDDRVINAAVRKLCDALDNHLVLDSHVNKLYPAKDVYLVACNQKGSIVVEYMVSDGPPGRRSFSRDFLSLAPAIKEFKSVAKHGWEFNVKKKVRKTRVVAGR